MLETSELSFLFPTH